MTYAAIIEGKITEKESLLLLLWWLSTFFQGNGSYTLGYSMKNWYFEEDKLCLGREAWGWGRGWREVILKAVTRQMASRLLMSMLAFPLFLFLFCVLFLSLQVKLTFESESPELTDWITGRAHVYPADLWNHWGSFWLGNHSALEMPLIYG